MSGLAAAVEEFVLAAAVAAPRPQRRLTRFLLVTAGLCLAAGIFFVAFSLDRYLEGLYTPQIAALATGFSAFIAAGVLLLARPKKEPPSDTAREISGNVRTLIEALCAELEDPVRQSPKVAMLMAAVTGFLMAEGRRV